MLSEVRKKQIKKLLKKLNIDSNDEDIFNIALTHPSYNYESNLENMPDYERLEFLGDSVLRLSVSNFLFEKYTNFDEGKLTKIRSYLVSDEFLSKQALIMGIENYINIGEHEEKDGGRQKESILACTLEAIFGAIYLSCSYEFAKKFIYKIYEELSEDFENILYSYNSKEILQQYTQSKNKDLPIYEVIEETGQAHEKTYRVSVTYQNEVLGIGEGKQKKEAEKNAAFKAIQKLNLTEGGKND